MGGRGASGTVTVEGNPWPAESLRRAFSRGLNLLALPSGVPTGFDAAQLQELTGANFVTRVGPRGRFQPYVPGIGGNFTIEPGEAYLLSLPASATVTLPAGQ